MDSSTLFLASLRPAGVSSSALHDGMQGVTRWSSPAGRQWSRRHYTTRFTTESMLTPEHLGVLIIGFAISKGMKSMGAEEDDETSGALETDSEDEDMPVMEE